MNEDKSETTGQRTDDPMLDHACTMRIALAIARRQNELDPLLDRNGWMLVIRDWWFTDEPFGHAE